jgi:cbb3-type cytochrome oxidase subunit 3
MSKRFGRRWFALILAVLFIGLLWWQYARLGEGLRTMPHF